MHEEKNYIKIGKLVSRLYKGIPDGFRTKIWPMLAESAQYGIKCNNSYK